MSDYTNIIQEINTNIADNTDQSITALKVRTTLIDMIGAVDENVTEAIGDIVVPTKTSDLTNDSGFITASALSGLATEQFVNEAVSAIDVPTKTSDLTNDSGFITATSLEPLVTKDELSNAGYVTESQLQQAGYVSMTQLTSMSYVSQSDLQSQLADYVTESQLSAMTYVTESQLQQAGYVSMTQLTSMSYVSQSDLQSQLADYVTESQLSAMTYVTESQLQQAGYATEAYVVDYVASHTGPIDLSAYVTKDELSAASYVTQSQLSANSYATTTQLNEAISGIDVPTKTSDLTNDSGFITASALSGLATEQYVNQAVEAIDVPTKTSDLTNDSGFITSSALSGLATETYVTNAISEINIPTKTSDLTNDSGFITSIPSEYITETELSAMSYVTQTDLTNASYATTTQLNTKQDTLVSGTNIKTINGETLLGEGDITIQAGSEDYSHVLTFTAEQANSSVSFVRQGSNTSLANAVLQYSTDNGETWNDYTLGTSISLAAIGDSVMFKGTNSKLAISGSDYHQFVMTGSIKASGDVTSLFNEVGGDFPMPAYGCKCLFWSCTSLTIAPALPSTTLSVWCYADLFWECTSLTQAPALPATTLAQYCYIEMFSGCTSLTQAPELPATALVYECYAYMFNGCTSLTQAPALPATTLAQGCYSGMFFGCSALTQAPALPATTLINRCYSIMFYGCTNLKYVKAMFTTTPSNTYTENWLNGVSSTGTFVKSSSATWTTTGTNAVPTGWTVYKAVSIDTDVLPESYVEDNSKVLQVVNGVWSKVNMTVPAIDESLIPNTTNTYTLGSSATQYAYTYSYSFIENGTNIKDIYTQTEIVTQAQYDALTTEQKNSETIYVISDQQAYMNNELVTESSLDSRGFLTAANFNYDANTGTLTLVL